LSSSGTTGSVPSRPAAAATGASVALGVGFTRLTRIVPPSSPRRESLSPTKERMEERPKTPSVVSLSRVLVARCHGVSAAAARYLAAPDRIESLLCTFDGAERDSHTGSLERVLVHALLRDLLPTSFPRGRSAPPEAGLLFRTRSQPCQRRGCLLRASSCLLRSATGFRRGRPREPERDAYDRLLLPTT